MTRRHWLYTLSASGACPMLPMLPATSFGDDKIPDFAGLVERVRAAHDMPGMGAAVLNTKSVLSLAVSGVRKRGDLTKIAEADAWHLGSLTKSMTAALFAAAVEAGNFAWDDPLKKYFPSCHADHTDTTLRELFEHRAGFAHSGPPDLWKAVSSKKGKPEDLRAWWVPRALKEPRALPHGEVSYSNLGCVVIGHLLERQVGKSAWEKLLVEQVGKPLKLTSLGFGPTAKNPSAIDGIWGHSIEGKPVTPGVQADNPAALGPAGTVHLNLPDLAKYVQWHLCEGAGQAFASAGKLKADSWKILHHTRLTPMEGKPAAGWFVASRPWAKGECFTHTGSNVMNYAIVWIAPKADLALISVANQGGDKARDACDRLLVEILKALGS